jgi:hypothetical protein
VHSTQPAADAAGQYVAEQLAIGRECFAAALRYLDLGWCPVPLCHPLHHGNGRTHVSRCGSPGKAPLVNWLEYQERRPTQKEVAEWWTFWPWSGVGVLLGPVSNLIGVDLDGPAAEAKLAEVCGGVLPDTLEFATPRPGRRLLYRIADGLELPSRTYALEGGELKLLGKGSMTVMPPSRHSNGGVYVWRPDHEPR